MIPYLLAAIGGYLIGQSTESKMLNNAANGSVADAGLEVASASVLKDGGSLSSGRVLPDLTSEELLFIKRWINSKTTSSGLLRKFMDKEDIKIANSLVKKGYMDKGKSDDAQSSVVYNLDLSSSEIEKIENMI